MIEIRIPGGETLRFEHLVLDYNGTLARDGKLLPGVRERIEALASHLGVHVVTADTFGRAREEMAGIPCEVSVLPPEGQTGAKRDRVLGLGASGVAAIGNGRNDRLMLEAAALGIAVVEGEGAAPETVLAADVVCRSALDALDLLLEPKRLVATLRT